MTFFSNSGVRFPNLEGQTRIAGHRALSGAADLWRLFAVLEGREGPPFEDERHLREQCIENLREAVGIYKHIVDNIPSEHVELSPAEYELAAVGPGFLEYIRQPFPPYLNLRSLYIEVIRRLEILISQLQAFETDREKETLVQPVFTMMRQWESLAAIGRIIAVLNRRS
jgi:hypothetical protein